MVVDHIHDHPQPHRVERLHHLAELHDPGRPVGVRGVGAFGGVVVIGIIAPIEGVLVRHGSHRRLLFCRIGSGRQRDVRFNALGRVFVDRRDVEDRQQMQVAEASLGQRLQVVDAVAVGQREGLELAAQGFRHAGVVDAEVAHVDLVDGDVFRRAQRRLGHGIPACRLERRVVQIHEQALAAVHGQRRRIGVGHHVVLDLPGAGNVDFDVVQVRLTLVRRIERDDPGALNVGGQGTTAAALAPSSRQGVGHAAPFTDRRAVGAQRRRVGTSPFQITPSGPS